MPIPTIPITRRQRWLLTTAVVTLHRKVLSVVAGIVWDWQIVWDQRRRGKSPRRRLLNPNPRHIVVAMYDGFLVMEFAIGISAYIILKLLWWHIIFTLMRLRFIWTETIFFFGLQVIAIFLVLLLLGVLCLGIYSWVLIGQDLCLLFLFLDLVKDYCRVCFACYFY